MNINRRSTRAPRRRALLILAACLVALTVSGQRGTVDLPATRLASAGFVSSAGGQLFLDGARWRFTGYDAYQVTSMRPGYECGGAYHQDKLEQIFSQMQQQSGSTAVRAWFFQSYGGPTRWSQYDRVLSVAAEHGIKVIPTLVNEWRQCEPLPSGEQAYRNLGWYQHGYRQTDGYRLSFRDFAVAMAEHYANNPTIAFWQLVNEAEAANTRRAECNENAAASALRSFADDVGGAMKAVDHNHLINLGTVGTGQCGIREAGYQYVYSSPAIDVCELHDYTNQAVAGGKHDGAVPDFNYCQAMNKPIFDGEVGIDASVQPDWSVSGNVTPATLATRAAFFQQKLNAFFDLGGSGFLIWSKSLSPSHQWSVGPGDPTEAVMLAAQAALGGGGTPPPPAAGSGSPGGGASTPGAAPGGSAATAAERAMFGIGAGLRGLPASQTRAALRSWLSGHLR